MFLSRLLTKKLETAPRIRWQFTAVQSIMEHWHHRTSQSKREKELMIDKWIWPNCKFKCKSAETHTLHATQWIWIGLAVYSNKSLWSRSIYQCDSWTNMCMIRNRPHILINLTHTSHACSWGALGTLIGHVWSSKLCNQVHGKCEEWTLHVAVFV